MDFYFNELTIDGLIHTNALAKAISEANLQKIRLLAPQTILNEELPPDFQKMEVNEHLETPIAVFELQFEVGDVLFEKNSWS